MYFQLEIQAVSDPEARLRALSDADGLWNWRFILGCLPQESWQGDISDTDDILVLFTLAGSTEQLTKHWI